MSDAKELNTTANFVAGNLTALFPTQSAEMLAACNSTSVPQPATSFDQVTACANFVMESTYTLLTNQTI